MTRRAVLLFAVMLFGGCEDLADAVRTHPDDMKRLGHGEVTVMERKF